MVALPRLVIGLDVETSDWDDHCSFRIQDEHLHLLVRVVLPTVGIDVRPVITLLA